MGLPVGNLLLRVLQFILTLITLALACSLPPTQHHNGNPTRINYAIFTTVFGMLTLLIPLFPSLVISYPRYHHPLISLLVDTLNTIFFLSAAIAVSAQLGVHSCNNRAYLLSNGITNGGGGNDWATMERRCRIAQSLAAFLWFALAAWAAAVLMDLVMYFRRKDATASGSTGYAPGTMGTTRGRSASRNRQMAQV